MPFTVAHVVAVLPGVKLSERLHLDPTCLVIGSMAPDFEYFARGEQVSRISHTLVGIAVWSIPATLILGALWHYLVKEPVLAALPARLARRVMPVFQPWRARWTGGAYLGLVVSAALGAATHLLWDGFTHAEGQITVRVAALDTIHRVPLLGAMPLHRILQHASTLLGLAVLVLYMRRWAPEEVTPAPGRARLRLLFGACIAIGLALMVLRLRVMHIGDPGSLIVGLISGVLAGTTVASALARVLPRRAV